MWNCLTVKDSTGPRLWFPEHHLYDADHLQIVMYITVIVSLKGQLETNVGNIKVGWWYVDLITGHDRQQLT